MIPILFDKRETSFTTNGIGRLSDCISCIVTEERNGIYECKFKYPITGKWYEYMREQGGTVACIHDDQKDLQPFDIYGYTAPIDGVVTFYAHHISYRLNHITVAPFTATSVADVFSQLVAVSNEENPFTFWTDKTTAGDFKLDHPESIRPLLGGQRGSILDTYGKGDYKFDKFVVRLYANRGEDTDVTIRYGKNLADMTVEYDKSGIYNTIRPYWKGSDGTVVIGGAVSRLQSVTEIWTDENGNQITNESGTEIELFDYGMDKIPVSMDFSSSFEEQPTRTQLEEKAAAFLGANQPWIPKQNIAVDFVQLWQTTEYADVAALQRVGLCDRVSIYYPELGVTAENQKVIRVVYNVLNERFDEMELGEPRTTLADDIRSSIREEFEEFAESGNFESIMQEAIDHATELITGGLGGHVVFTLDANGKPQEILIMDTEDVNTAVHVLRINQNGIGFSSTGYEGPFTTAWTLDGSFVADFITSGHITANIIQGGTLTLGGANNGNGVMRLLDSTGQQVGLFNKDGADVTGKLTTKYGNQKTVVGSGEIEMTYNDVITGAIRPTTYSYYNEYFGVTKGPYNVGEFRSTAEGLLLRSNNCEMFLYGASGTDQTITGRESGHMRGNMYFDQIVTKDINMFLSSGSNRGRYVEIYRSADLEIGVDESFYAQGSIRCGGTKNRIVKTDDYGTVALNAMESTCCVFSDLGSGTIDETGVCYVYIDPDFAETIDLIHEYQVFTTQTSEGSIDWIEKDSDFFIVHGTANTDFDWIVYARQKEYSADRLEQVEEHEPKIEKPPYEFTKDDLSAEEISEDYMSQFETDYDQLAEDYLLEYESEVSEYEY